MLCDDLNVTDGASAGAWIRPRLGGEFGAVTLQVPKDYEAYARVLHPARDSERNPVSWAEVADALGRTAHREMQWHALVGSSDSFNFTGSKWAGGSPSRGRIDHPTLDSLCGYSPPIHLTRRTASSASALSRSGRNNSRPMS